MSENACRMRPGSEPYSWTCDKCRATWTQETHGRDWLPSACPNKGKSPAELAGDGVPTVDERYAALRKNAEAFVESMRIMVASLERDGNIDEASHHRVWSLMPWEAAIAADDSGDLWPICEACGKPIKGDVVSGGECDLHPACAP